MTFKLVTEKIFINNGDYIIDKLIKDVNEGIGDNIQSIINKISDKKKALINLIKRFNEESNAHNRKRLAKIIVVLFITIYGGEKVYQAIKNNDQQNAITNIIANDNEISFDKIVRYFKELINGKEIQKDVTHLDVVKYNSADLYKTSKLAKDIIKQYEKLRLKGYKIKGDGKITIGWGHAEPIKKSKYKVGQVITKELADALFELDVKVAEDGVKRIFSAWKLNGNDIHITQGMFDAMVSIAFNAGVDGLRTSKFIQFVKRKKFEEAKEAIIDVANSGKFAGLDIRREAEKRLYSM